ncbi:hypothetical protein [Arthrobacter sp. ov118]|uniref:hypothetical protein n=1 Tax=Arthrobacter sp. ov118 TaxID=1761747 RepID=UPI0008EC1E05|nr:hypothetical protein [Arthrobacter sp. ov118]SFU05522.1 hypothetical protein SAMN04487915_10958 [Arthrobacter sp. ov118]
MRSVPRHRPGSTTADGGGAAAGSAWAHGGTASGGAASGGTPSGGTVSSSTKAAAVGLFAGFAGFGAGAVNLAISASLLLPPAAGAGAPPAGGLAAAGAVAGIWGLAVLAWTVLTLRRGQLMRTGPTTALLAAAALVHAVAAAGGQSMSSGSLVVSHLAALLLTLMILAAAGWLRRHGSGAGTAPGGADTASLRPGRLLLAAFGCAVLVAAVATPGLAASTAGHFAVPHGSHGAPASGHHGG